MAWRIVKQPNGLLARFSDIVDNFTEMNMTEAEAVEVCREYMGRDEALKKVQRGVDDLDMYTYKPNGELCRWKDSISRIKGVHGAAEAERVLAIGQE